MKKFLFLILIALPILCSAEQIDINSATPEELDKITGVGPAIAQRIADARPYSSIDDLLNVKGIGPATLQEIKDQGLACVSCAQETQATGTAPQAQIAPAAQNYPDDIFINELLPNPEGADETDEWFELYNSNAEDVNLSDWQVKDLAGSQSIFKIPKNTHISAYDFLVFKRPQSKIMLNNDEDGLVLLAPNGEIKDQVSFLKAPLGQSYSRGSSTWAWSTTLTPGSKNIISGIPSKVLPKSKKSDNNKIVEAGLADLSHAKTLNQENQTSNPWFLFFIVLGFAIVLGGITIFIKFKFEKIP